MSNSHKLLIEEAPLQVLPTLAVKIGLNEAIFLQQLHYRLRVSVTVVEGRRWLHRTAEEWAEEMPFWSVPTIRRIVTTLRDSGLIMTRDDLNQMRIDRTLWYSINYSKIPGDEIESPGDENVSPGDQVDHSSLSSRSPGYTGPGDQVDHTNNKRIKEADQDHARATDKPQPKKEPEALGQALLLEAYHRLGKFPPSIQDKKGRELLALADRLTEQYGLDACLRQIETLRERNLELIQNGDAKGIKSPIHYLSALLENQTQEPDAQAPGQPNEHGIQEEEYKSTLPPGVVIDWGDLPMPLNWPKGDNS